MSTTLLVDLIRELTRLHGVALQHSKPVYVCISGDTVNCFAVDPKIEHGRVVLYADTSSNAGRLGIPYTTPPRAA